jgi:hypothetical protein
VSLTEDALATAFRTGLPFVGLRDHAHDPDLDRLIPPDAARTARAIPLTADDDRIRLAVADPDTDLSTLDKYLAGRQIDLALAPREEIDTILGPPPPQRLPTEAAAPTEPPLSESEPEPAADTEPEPSPLAVEHDPLVAEPETDGVAEGEQVADEEAASSDDVPSEPPPSVAEAEPEPVGALAPADPAALSDADAELAGEVPSWLEPARRRWWRVVLAVLLVLVVLAAAAVAVVALVNA